MLPLEHSAILLIYLAIIGLEKQILVFFLSGALMTGFTVSAGPIISVENTFEVKQLFV